MKKGKLFTLVASFAFAICMNVHAADKTTVDYTLTPVTQQEVDNIINIAKTDPMTALNEFSTFIDEKNKTYKKELKKKEALVLCGQQFLKAGLSQQAAEMGRLAYETDGSYFPAIMLYGDALYEMKKYGDASALYEAAMSVEAEEKKAYLKTADVYMYINKERALEVLDQFKQKFPSDPDVNKAMGDIYYHYNEIDKAKECYDTYFSQFKGEDIEADIKYSIILFAKKDFQGCLDKVNATLPKAPKEISLNRMKFYSLMELMQVNGAKEAADNFFGKYDEKKYNGTDYKYEGQLAEMLNDTAMMVSSYEHAAKLDPEKAEIQLGLSEAYEKIGEANKAVEAYKKYLEITNPGAKSAQGLLKLGKIYYSCAASITDPAKSETKKKYVEEGDKYFTELENMAKDSYLGPLWRARIRTILDPDNPIEEVKKAYDVVYERLKSKDDSYNSERKECLVYSAFYYFKKDDYAQAKSYCQQVLAIDPSNGLAKQILGACAQLKK